ncbi:hypothetical protein BDQ12DRAFT_735950 [Crucibulum laeve]|uniref:RRM domain-containing protein n=1 Tax=Crucibulum laeve TaxID=68775 RepID=A0A5C3LXS2_9AGAR|nr:hypothetical protein BDQ12DRAFT_735950 [Crucibulum laeve]
MATATTARTMTNAPQSGGQVYSFQGLINSVKVENISENVGRNEVAALFNTLIGKVCAFQERQDVTGSYLQISFNSREAAQKALCMSGYSLGGTNITVSAITPPRPNPKGTDDRRNLYVLGLPFNLTKSEFSALFSHYGTVSHCVILATVDNSSRRRGFVVMSSHEEARKALTALTRTQIKGHLIDVSWAVVQRSQGFLDGGDRSLLLESRPSPLFPSLPNLAQPSKQCMPRSNSYSHPTSSPSSDSPISPNSSLSSSSSFSTIGSHTQPQPQSFAFTPSSTPTLSLLIIDLPAVLFSHHDDLHPLLYPFGEITKLEVLNRGTTTAKGQESRVDTVSVLVEYTLAESAQEAREALHRQRYVNDRSVQAMYVNVVPVPAGAAPPVVEVPCADPPHAKRGVLGLGYPSTLRDKNLNAPLNDLAGDPHLYPQMSFGSSYDLMKMQPLDGLPPSGFASHSDPSSVSASTPFVAMTPPEYATPHHLAIPTPYQTGFAGRKITRSISARSRQV